MGDTVTLELEVTEPVAEQIEAAAQLTDGTPEDLLEESVLNRLQAVDNILHEDAHIELPADFDAEAWRERYENIRRPETY